MSMLPPRPSRPSLGGGTGPGLPGRPSRPVNPRFTSPNEPEQAPEEQYVEPAAPAAEEPAWEPATETYDEPAAEEDYPAVADETDSYATEYETAPVEEAPYLGVDEEFDIEETIEPVYEAPLTNEELAEEIEEDISDEDRELQDTIASFSPEVRDAATKLLGLIIDENSTEVLLNGPDKIMFKQQGVRYLANFSFPDIETYHKVINTVILSATDTPDRLGTAQYQIEGPLTIADPEGGSEPLMTARVHMIAPPVVKAAQVTIAKKSRVAYRIDDLMRLGSMNSGMAEFLKALARGRATVVISGGTGSGKTTLLEAMSHEFDENDRVAVVEDTPELRIPLTDVVPLRSTSVKPGDDENDRVTLGWLVEQANRMRMDRIIVGEIRGSEMAEFLNAANSGVEGSMTTVHADTPPQTLDKMVSLAMKNPSVRSGDSVYRDIANTVHVVVQVSLVDNRDHRITEIREVSDTRSATTGIPQMQTLFEYNRTRGLHTSPGGPSQKLKSFLANRGVEINNNWFMPRGN